MSVIIMVFWLFSSFSGSLDKPGIDFNPRLLQKELDGILSQKAYKMVEIPAGKSTAEDNIPGKFFIVKCPGTEEISVYIGRVNSCRTGGCSDPSDTGIDVPHEYFDYFIIFDSLKKVKVVRVFNYEATHGHEVIIKKWLDQFSGYDCNKQLRVGKEVDSISGATISVNAIVTDVKEKTMLLSKCARLNN